MTDRDAARTALAKIVGDAVIAEAKKWPGPRPEGDLGWWGATSSEIGSAALDAAAVARQDVPCETCLGRGFMVAEGRYRNEHPPCENPKCDDGHTPGPLLIDVMMGWELAEFVLVERVTRDDKNPREPLMTRRAGEPVYRRTPTGED